ncbi:MAG: hypothetical protein IPP72_06755 [Chitinophagaceae bacterium]|nr:hypothetical protein [Chitinophagaceae bacterium]
MKQADELHKEKNIFLKDNYNKGSKGKLEGDLLALNCLHGPFPFWGKAGIGAFVIALKH